MCDPSRSTASDTRYRNHSKVPNECIIVDREDSHFKGPTTQLSTFLKRKRFNRGEIRWQVRQRQRRAIPKRTPFNRGEMRRQVRQRQRRAIPKRSIFNRGEIRWQVRQRQRRASPKRTLFNRGEIRR